MKLLDKQGNILATVSVLEGKAGQRFHRLSLDAKDMAELYWLRPAELREWIGNWMCGFPPLTPGASSDIE